MDLESIKVSGPEEGEALIKLLSESEEWVNPFLKTRLGLYFVEAGCTTSKLRQYLFTLRKEEEL